MKKKIVLTGGPSGGKTTALSIIKESFGIKTELVKEAATLVYGGGFPRKDNSVRHTYHAQRIIYFVSKELEELACETSSAPLVICDRGTVDGAAYWPYGEDDFFKNMGTTKETELARYHTVLHLTPPTDPSFYQTTGVRTENLEEALRLDKKFLEIWKNHPRRIIIDFHSSYFEKVKIINNVIAKLLEEEK